LEALQATDWMNMAARDPSPDDIAHLTAMVRTHDRPRYYATLFAPPERRADLLALFAFAAEIARIPDLVSESGLGEIRLQWWREGLASAAFASEAGQSPTLRALGETIERHKLPLAPFEALVEARSADLYSDPPAAIGDLEGRLGETESALFQMAAIVLGADASQTADAAGHAGVAYGLARRLSVFASDRARGRTIVPGEILAAHSLAASDVFAPEPPAALREATSALEAIARRHLVDAREHVRQVGRPARSAFLPLAIVEPLLARIDRAAVGLIARPVGLSDLETLTRIAWARLRNA
jgi:phytoene synthase